MPANIARHSFFQVSCRVRGTENGFKSLFPWLTNYNKYVTRLTYFSEII